MTVNIKLLSKITEIYLFLSSTFDIKLHNGKSLVSIIYLTQEKFTVLTTPQ